MKEFTSNSPARKALKKEVATRLRWFRETQGMTAEQAAIRGRIILKRGNESPCYADSSLLQRFVSGGIDAIEDETVGFVELTRSDCRFLAEMYSVNDVLVDPLVSTPIEEHCLIEHFRDFLLVGGRPEKTSQFRAEYWTPERKLISAQETSIVHLVLQPHGRSDRHWHPGDELLFVRRGSVDLLLLGQGFRIRLNERDFVHFYAEQEHFAVNTTDETAEVFVIRFLRSEARSEFLNLLSQLRGKPKASTIARANYELQALLAPLPRSYRHPAQAQRSASNEERTVLDRYGLARFLRLACSAEFRGQKGRLTLDQLHREGAGKGFNRAKLHRLQHGEANLTERELTELAEIFDTQPILLFEYLFPAQRPSVAVRSQFSAEFGQHDTGDLIRAPARFLAPTGASYWIPCRKLADSDVSITYLQLSAGGMTPENRHPGHEILLPLKGDFELRFGPTATAISANEPGFAHFNSRHTHQVRNPGPGESEALVVRVYLPSAT